MELLQPATWDEALEAKAEHPEALPLWRGTDVMVDRVAPATGAQQFSKVGTRNAMVIAVCSFAPAIDDERRKIGTCLGSAAPTARGAREAEAFIEANLDWDARSPIDDEALHRFGDHMAAAASPIDDQRGSAAYRRHALAVMTRRTLEWAWSA